MEIRATDSKAVTKLQTTSSTIEKSSSGHLNNRRVTHQLDGLAVNCDGHHRRTENEDNQREEVKKDKSRPSHCRKVDVDHLPAINAVLS
jgi:hypothetical protein